jgi:RNA polymerase sigma-70 factor (ECF subfamily)
VVRLTTTTELLVALRRGRDEPAWNLFVDRYRPVLVGVARQLGLGAEDSQDAAQQTLLEFVRDFGLGRYDRTRSRLRSWLMAILRHRVADLHRLRVRQGTRDSRSDIELAELDRSASETLDRMWQSELDRRVLEEALGRLRADAQIADRSLRAFELTVLQDVPAEAAAEACGMTVNAVYIARGRIASRLRRIIAALEPAFDEAPE